MYFLPVKSLNSYTYACVTHTYTFDLSFKDYRRKLVFKVGRCFMCSPLFNTSSSMVLEGDGSSLLGMYIIYTHI
jgi:hypothetical protein